MNHSKDKKSRKVTLASVGYAFKNIIWPRKKLLFVGLILIIINRLSGLVLPGASKYLVDDVINKANISLLYILIAAVAGAVLVQSVTSFALTRLLSVEAQQLISVLRAKVQKHIIYLPIRFFDNTKSGEAGFPDYERCGRSA
jgi:subfamily B ATP-binding cassette protein MsbA